MILALTVESHPAEDVTEAMKREKEECNITNIDVHLSQKILNKKVSYILLMIKTKNI